MALIPCHECAHQVSDKAVACPSCGAPVVRSPAGSEEVAPAAAETTPTAAPGPAASARSGNEPSARSTPLSATRDPVLPRAAQAPVNQSGETATDPDGPENTILSSMRRGELDVILPVAILGLAIAAILWLTIVGPPGASSAVSEEVAERRCAGLAEDVYNEDGALRRRYISTGDSWVVDGHRVVEVRISDSHAATWHSVQLCTVDEDRTRLVPTLDATRWQR